MPIIREGIHIGYRPAAKVGLPDILGIIPPTGRFLGIEIKTGRDKMRPEQVSFHQQSSQNGAVMMVVKDFQDFKDQFAQIDLTSN